MSFFESMYVGGSLMVIVFFALFCLYVSVRAFSYGMGKLDFRKGAGKSIQP